MAPIMAPTNSVILATSSQAGISERPILTKTVMGAVSGMRVRTVLTTFRLFVEAHGGTYWMLFDPQELIDKLNVLGVCG